MSSKAADRLLGQVERGSAFVLSGPAGTGKTTLVAKLMKEFPNVRESVSWTTRAARPNEVDGEHYHFVTQEQFDAKAAEGGFLEHVRLFDCAYGTCRDHVEEQLNKGIHIIMVIDVQGAIQLKKKYSSKLIFVRPPSARALKRRLLGRRTENEEELHDRLERAMEELRYVDEYDYQIINEHFNTAYQVLRSILIAEAHAVNKSQNNPKKEKGFDER